MNDPLPIYKTTVLKSCTNKATENSSLWSQQQRKLISSKQMITSLTSFIISTIGVSLTGQAAPIKSLKKISGVRLNIQTVL